MLSVLIVIGWHRPETIIHDCIRSIIHNERKSSWKVSQQEAYNTKAHQLVGLSETLYATSRKIALFGICRNRWRTMNLLPSVAFDKIEISYYVTGREIANQTWPKINKLMWLMSTGSNWWCHFQSKCKVCRGPVNFEVASSASFQEIQT